MYIKFKLLFHYFINQLNFFFSGLQNYKIQVYKLRSVTALRFIHTRMCLLSTSCDLEENFVRVRWRVLGLKQLAALRRLQTYGKFWKISKIPDRQLEKDAVYVKITFSFIEEMVTMGIN